MQMNDRRSPFHIGPVRGSLEVLYNINLIDKFIFIVSVHNLCRKALMSK